MPEILHFAETHLDLTLIIVAILVALIVIEVIRQTRGNNRLSPAQLTQLINRENTPVIDIRSKEEYNKGHIASSINITDSDLSNSLKKIEKFKNKPIVLVCNLGQSSAKTALKLNKAGYQTLLLSGGNSAWVNAGLPLVKG